MSNHFSIPEASDFEALKHPQDVKRMKRRFKVLNKFQ